MNDPKFKHPRLFFLMLFSVCVVTPFGTDIFIASLPEINRIFVTKSAELAVSVFLLGLASTQLFYGPLLDRFGRKPVLIGGLALYVVASVVTVLSGSIEQLLIGRFFQAAGACGTIVSLLAIVQDIFPRQRRMAIIGAMMGIIGFCPVLSPVLGSYLQVHWGWRAGFVFLLALGIYCLVLVIVVLRETSVEKKPDALAPQVIFRKYLSLLSNGRFRSYALTSCFSYAILFSYVAVSPFFLIDHFELPVAYFGMVFATIAIPLVLMSYLAPVLTKNSSTYSMTVLAALTILLGALIMVGANLVLGEGPELLVIPMLIAAFGIGAINALAGAAALELFPGEDTGSASAMYNFFCFAGGAVFSALISYLAGRSLLAFAVSLVVLGAAAAAAAVFPRPLSGDVEEEKQA